MAKTTNRPSNFRMILVKLSPAGIVTTRQGFFMPDCLKPRNGAVENSPGG